MNRLSDVQNRILAKLRDGQYCSAQVLGNTLGLSDKTIRKEIDSLNEILQENGALIESRVRHGCRLCVTDEALFDEVFRSYDLRDQQKYILSSGKQRTHALIRYFLCSEEKLQLSDLAETLYTNETAIKNAVREARAIIRDFKIRLVSARDGVSMSGKEHDLRTLLTYEYDLYRFSSEIDTDAEPYAVLYDFDPAEMKKITDAMIEIMRPFDNYNLSKYSIDYIARIIMISRVRSLQGKHLDYTPNEVMHFSEFRSFLPAAKIVKKSGEILDCAFTENETILITICLAGLRVITEYTEELSRNYLIARRFAMELVDHISDLNRFERLRTDNRLINETAFYLMSYMFRADYHIFTSQLTSRRKKNIPPMPKKMAIQAFMYLYQEYQMPYREEEILRMAMIIHPSLGRQRLDIIHLNALVVSDVDIAVGRGMAERLERSFGETLNRIDVLQPYELAEADLSAYDMVFTSYEPEMLRKTAGKEIPPVFILHPFFRNTDKNRIHRFLLDRISAKSRNGKDFAYLSPRNLCYDVRASSGQECIRLLCEMIENDIDNAERLQAELEISEFILPTAGENNVVLLSGLSSHAENVMVAILVLNRSILWGEEKNKVQIIVYWDQGKMDSEASLFEFGYLPNFLQSAFRRENIIEALLRKEPADVINKILSEYRLQMSAETGR